MILYYPKLEKLKEYNLSEENISRLDKFIASLPINYRFSPILFTKKIKINKKKSVDIAFLCVKEGLLKLEYELTCPECSSDVISSSNLSEFPDSEVICDVCGEDFLPSEDDIWIFLYSINTPKIRQNEDLSRTSISYKELKNNIFLIDLEDNDFFNIDCDKLKSLIKLVEKAVSNNEKKKTLESLGEYLFENVKGLRVVDKNTRTMTSELDLIVENNNVFHPFLKNMGLHFIIECKNWSNPVGTSEIRDFAGDIQIRGIKFGILISKEGISGTEYKDAKRLIADYFKKGLTIPIMNLEDIKNIAFGENLITFLRKKCEEIQFKWC